MLPRGVTATDETWMKFQALGKPAAGTDTKSEAPLPPRPVSNLIVLSPRRTV